MLGIASCSVARGGLGMCFDVRLERCSRIRMTRMLMFVDRQKASKVLKSHEHGLVGNQELVVVSSARSYPSVDQS